MVSRTRGTAQLFRAPAAAKVPEITLLVIGLAWLVRLPVLRRLRHHPADHG